MRKPAVFRARRVGLAATALSRRFGKLLALACRPVGLAAEAVGRGAVAAVEEAREEGLKEGAEDDLGASGGEESGTVSLEGPQGRGWNTGLSNEDGAYPVWGKAIQRTRMNLKV